MASILCSNCFVSPVDNQVFRVCAGCHCVRYCSEACQIAHWECGHESHCSNGEVSVAFSKFMNDNVSRLATIGMYVTDFIPSGEFALIKLRFSPTSPQRFVYDSRVNLPLSDISMRQPKLMERLSLAADGSKIIAFTLVGGNGVTYTLCESIVSGTFDYLGDDDDGVKYMLYDSMMNYFSGTYDDKSDFKYTNLSLGDDGGKDGQFDWASLLLYDSFCRSPLQRKTHAPLLLATTH